MQAGRLTAPEWKPFELHPEIPVHGIPREQVARRGGGSGALRQLLREDGIRLVPPPVIWNSRLALLAAEHARDLGAHARVHDRLFRAAWQEGRDLGRADVLAATLDECDVDGTALVAAAATWGLVDRLTDALESAWSAGITGTPSYVLPDGRVLRGVQPVDALVAA